MLPLIWTRFIFTWYTLPPLLSCTPENDYLTVYHTWPAPSDYIPSILNVASIISSGTGDQL